MKPGITDLSAMTAYYEGYADGMSAVVQRWSRSLGKAFVESPESNLGGQLEADHARHRTAINDLEEDR